MNDHDSTHAEDAFFDALTAGDARRLEPLLDDRFLIVDVMSGAVADRTAIVGALDERILEFERIDVVERAVREYGDTAIVVGRTQMAGRFAGAAFAAASRYTHVFVRGADARWRLASAQGTPIVEPADGGGGPA
jgi:ketosteroid isomerase-like protein